MKIIHKWEHDETKRWEYLDDPNPEYANCKYTTDINEIFII